MKLFVTVGTQYPFDRLVRTVDRWANEQADVEIFAQTGPGTYRPRNMRCAAFISADECRRHAEWADITIAHAGMGSIITALELCKPIVVMPRRADLGEHRNDHQLATARKLLAQGKVIAAFDEGHLREKLNNLEALVHNSRSCGEASPRLIATLRQFALTGRYAAARKDFTPEDAEVNPMPQADESLEIANQGVHG